MSIHEEIDTPEPPDAPPPPCVHKFVLFGVVWHVRCGHNGNLRYYEDKMFCEKCLETRYINERLDSHSYGPPVQGSFQK